MRKRAWLITNLTFALLTIGASYLVIAYRQHIQDWWVLQSYTAPAEIEQLATDTTMTANGRNLFYASQPKVEDSEEFNNNCSNTGEKSLVLGCYSAKRIHLFNVIDARLDGVKQVTAAHETLHAVYARLDSTEKANVNALLAAELPLVTDTRLQELIELYNKVEPGQLMNEMHSILGTEYPNLTPELEAYYKRYFSNRGQIVNYATKYREVFTASMKRIEELSKQIIALKLKIDANTTAITRQKTELDTQVTQLEALRSTDVAAYNKAVPGYNTKVRDYNNLVVATRTMVDSYNELVVEHNGEAIAQNDLYHSLDSRYQTVAN